MARPRVPRDTETREATAKRKTWQRPNVLPAPEPRDGKVYRWIRTSLLGQSDMINVSAKFREGWVPVKSAEFPELNVMSDFGSRFPDNIEIGGLLLCENSAETMRERREAQMEMTATQLEAVDNSFMRESDPRMPVLKPERRTRTSATRFGDD